MPKKIRIKHHIKMGRRKGIFLLPNIFTTISLFFGFFSIIYSIGLQFFISSISILIAFIFDSLDGRVARIIKVQSDFGAEYDSLSDMIAFGLAPSLMVYNFSIQILENIDWKRFSWLSSFIYIACVALRLAKFNTRIKLNSALAKRYFFGMPCPASAIFLSSMIWLCNFYNFNNYLIFFLSEILIIIFGLLMVSNIRYRSYKDIDIRSPVKSKILVAIILIIGLIAFQPIWTVFILSGLYITSGPIYKIKFFLQQKKKK